MRSLRSSTYHFYLGRVIHGMIVRRVLTYDKIQTVSKEEKLLSHASGYTGTAVCV